VDVPSDDFCPPCFMLPDPRDSPSHQRQPKPFVYVGQQSSLYDDIYLATEYQARLILSREQTTEELLDLSRDMADYTDDLLRWVAWRDLTREDSVVLGLVIKRLCRTFWDCVNNGEIPLDGCRILILQLRAVFEQSAALNEALDTLSDDEIETILPPEGYGHMEPVGIHLLPRDELECPVCMTSYESNEENACGPPIELKCNHTFGKQCIQKWFADNETCPVCRDNGKQSRPEVVQVRLVKSQHPPPQWLQTLGSDYYTQQPFISNPVRRAVIRVRYRMAFDKANHAWKRFYKKNLNANTILEASLRAEKRHFSCIQERRPIYQRHGDAGQDLALRKSARIADRARSSLEDQYRKEAAAAEYYYKLWLVLADDVAVLRWAWLQDDLGFVESLPHGSARAELVNNKIRKWGADFGRAYVGGTYESLLATRRDYDGRLVESRPTS
jgi:hypothetical protein